MGRAQAERDIGAVAERFRRGAPLNAIKCETIYTETGYNDYPLLSEAAE